MHATLEQVIAERIEIQAEHITRQQAQTNEFLRHLGDAVGFEVEPGMSAETVLNAVKAKIASLTAKSLESAEPTPIKKAVTTP